ASGKAVDYRSDQFSLGSVLYEMATGKPAFERKTKPETLAAIIRDDPEPVGAVNPQVPAPLRWILERCFAKDPEDRYVSTKDLARDFVSVRNYLSDSASGAASLDVTPRPRRRAWIRAGIEAAVVIAVGVIFWIVGHAAWQNPLAGATFSRFTSWEGSELDASISDDGKFVAFLADHEGPFDAWVGQVGSGEFLNLTKGQQPSLANSFVHNIGFSGDGVHAWFRINTPDGRHHSVWLVPTI